MHYFFISISENNSHQGVKNRTKAAVATKKEIMPQIIQEVTT